MPVMVEFVHTVLLLLNILEVLKLEHSTKGLVISQANALIAV